MITIYTITYNEELMLQFVIDHYRSRFPGCRIVIYDNLSTDNTVNIAEVNGCEVIQFDTNGQFQDRRLMDIKNNCWKDAKTDWVLTSDLDELLDINEAELKKEEEAGTSIIRSEGYEMVAMDEKLDIAGMKYGARESGEDKAYLFNKKFISEINYDIGCHVCNPIGTISYSNKAYKLYHYSYINYDVTVQRYKVLGARKRKSPEDMKYGWGGHLETPEEIHDLYEESRKQAIKVR